MIGVPGEALQAAVKVIVVSDICLYREGLKLILREDPQIEVTAAVAKLDEAVQLAGQQDPGVFLIDISMAGALNAIRELLELAPEANVVALTVGEREDLILACAEAGVAGFVTRDAGIDHLCRCICAAKSRELYCSPKIAGWLCRRVSRRAARPKCGVPEELTEREREILALIERGLPNKGIARSLSIELPTVKSHVHNILRKLDARTRGEAAAILRRSNGQDFGDPRVV